ncbi:MAG: glycosyltransferase family 4 protein [Proteobacteria bacterium]|nr:glycosyltransferase family 4 protein [Pseudomonadota bacterium]
MNVALSAVAGTLGGPATYAIELASALAKEFPADDYTVFTDQPDAFAGRVETVRVRLRSAWEQPLWDHLWLRRALLGHPAELFHGTKGVLPGLLGRPGVVTVHDVAHLVYPESFALAQRLHLALETPRSISLAQVVLTDSQSTARDLASHYPAVSDKVEVVPLGVPAAGVRPGDDQIEAWRREQGIGPRVIGYLGTVQPRKNLDLLVDAFSSLSAGSDLQLLVAGRLRPGYRPAFLDRDLPGVRYLGPLDDEEIPLFLGSLRCMVSPSSYEGFGLTFLEAMAAGCPVVGFANSSIPEVVGEAGLLVENEDSASLAAAIGRLLDDDELAEQLAKAGLERAANFTWSNTARLTRAVYARALAAGRGQQ